MPRTIEEASDEYQTLRVLAQEDSIETTIQSISSTTDGIAFEISFNNITKYIPINLTPEEISPAYAFLYTLTDTHEISESTLTQTSIEISTESDLNEITIHSPIEDYTTELVDSKSTLTPDKRAVVQEHIGKKDTDDLTIYFRKKQTEWEPNWSEITKLAALSHWYYTNKNPDQECIQVQVDEISTPTDDTIPLHITTQTDTQLTIPLPTPESADTDTDASAALIEKYGGDIEFLEDAELYLSPTRNTTESTQLSPDNTLTKTENDHFSVFVDAPQPEPTTNRDTFSYLSSTAGKVTSGLLLYGIITAQTDFNPTTLLSELTLENIFIISNLAFIFYAVFLGLTAVCLWNIISRNKIKNTV